MRWYSLVSLLSDGRVQFLLGFVIVAAIVALVLTVIEARLKRKVAPKKEVDEKLLRISKIKKFINSEHSEKEKLDLINREAKDFFKEKFSHSPNMGYSDLRREFEKGGRREYAEFCKSMFLVYYSSQTLGIQKIRFLSDRLISLIHSKEREEASLRVPSRKERFFLFLDRILRVPKQKKSSKELGIRKISFRKSRVLAKSRKLARENSVLKKEEEKLRIRRERDLRRLNRSAKKGKKRLARKERKRIKSTRKKMKRDEKRYSLQKKKRKKRERKISRKNQKKSKREQRLERKRKNLSERRRIRSQKKHNSISKRLSKQRAKEVAKRRKHERLSNKKKEKLAKKKARASSLAKKRNMRKRKKELKRLERKNK